MSDAPLAQARELSAGSGAALVFAAALLAAALMAAPVILRPSERIFGSGEILSREDPNLDALVVIDQFRTGRVPAPYLQPLTDLPGRALAPLIGPVPAYNFVVLVSFPLAAAAAYLLARYVLVSHLAAMVAGLAYAFLPFHVMQAGGHPHIAQTQWVPLYLLALWACVDRPGPGRAALLVLAAAAVSLADFYAGFIIAVLSPVALLAYGMASSPPSTESRVRRMGATALVLLGAAIAGIGAIRAFVPAVAANPQASAFSRSDLFAWSARWWSYLVPPDRPPDLGIRGQGILEPARCRSGSPRTSAGESRTLPRSPLSGRPPGLAARARERALEPDGAGAGGGRDGRPAVLALSERAIGSFTFVRPSALLYALAPMFRAYARFGVVVGLMTSLLAGAGFARLWGRGLRSRVAAVALLGLAIVEYAPFPPWRSRDVLPTAAHRWMSRQPGSLRVLDCVDSTRASARLAGPLLGNSVSVPGDPGLEDCGEPRLGEKLRSLGYTHVIFRRDTRAASWLALDPARFAARGALTPGLGFRDAWIFSVNPEPPRVFLESWTGFHPREYDAERTWRWMARAGELRFAGARDEGEAILDIELRSFPANRRVEWSANGRRGDLEVTPQWRRYELPLGPLGRGGFALTFACSEPAVIAHDVLLNHDSRPLGLAVGGWTFRGPDR